MSGTSHPTMPTWPPNVRMRGTLHRWPFAQRRTYRGACAVEMRLFVVMGTTFGELLPDGETVEALGTVRSDRQPVTLALHKTLECLCITSAGHHYQFHIATGRFEEVA